MFMSQEKESIQKRLIKSASKDDTNQLVVEELRHQQGVEANRLVRVLSKSNLLAFYCCACSGEREGGFVDQCCPETGTGDLKLEVCTVLGDAKGAVDGEQPG